MDRAPAAYRWFVLLGLGGVVGTTIWTALRHSSDPNGGPTLVVAIAGLTIWFAVFFAFWWYWLVLRDPPAEHPSPGTISAGSVGRASWSSLAAAMALGERGAEAVRAADRRANRGVAWFLLFGMAVVGVVLGGAWLTAIGVRTIGGFPTAYLQAGAILALVGAYVVFMLLGGMRRVVWMGEEVLEPLGLSIVEVPGVALVPTASGGRAARVGDGVVAGTRHGRRVEVHFSRTKQRTMVGAPTEPFSFRAVRGRLTVHDGSADGAKGLVAEIPPASRWRGLRVRGGPEGLLAERPVGDGRGWLYDLWLLERLADLVRT